MESQIPQKKGNSGETSYRWIKNWIDQQLETLLFQPFVWSGTSLELREFEILDTNQRRLCSLASQEANDSE
jgi:hypothetical protein